MAGEHTGKPDLLTEKFYTPAEVAEILAISYEYARELIRREPGIVVLGDEPGTRRKRPYTTVRVPASVPRRMIEKYTKKAKASEFRLGSN